MHSLIKTALVAAVGVAVASVSPAFAAKAYRGDSVRAALIYQDAYAYQPGYAYASAYGSSYDPLTPAPYWSDPGSAQIVNEYLKSPSVHNGSL